MKIHVSHDGEKFGPYEEMEARSMYLDGRIANTYLVWHEGPAEWQPASQVFSKTPSLPQVAELQVPASVAEPHRAMMDTGFVAASKPDRLTPTGIFWPMPPKLHWALVALFSLLTFGLFAVVWFFVQASWIRKIDPGSKATKYLVGQVVLAIVGGIMSEFPGAGAKAVGGILTLSSYVLFYCAYYSMRRSMLHQFNVVKPMGLKLSGLMTFFFSTLYLQHHMTRIARWRVNGAPKQRSD